MIEERNLLFIIPNNDIGGSQNFLKRLFKNIPCDKKTFYVEDLESFGSFNILHRTWSIYKNIKNLLNGKFI